MSFAYAAGVITQTNETSQSTVSPHQSSITNGVRFYVTAHLYSNDDFIQITGGTPYDGAWVISNVAADTFDMVNQGFVFSSAVAGTVARGDADLSGMSGLTDVTTEVSGSFTLTNMTINKLSVIGALLIDPDTDCLLTESGDGFKGIVVSDYGYLHLGNTEVVNGYQFTQTGVVYINTDNPALWWQVQSEIPVNEAEKDGALRVEGVNAKLVWRNVIVQLKSGLQANGFTIRDNATAEITNGILVTGKGNAATGRHIISAFQSPNVTVNGFRMIRGELLFGATSPGGIYNGLVREAAPIAVFPNRVSTYEFRDLDVGGKGNVVDVSIQTEDVTNTHTTVTNSSTGNNLIIIGGQDAWDIRNQGTVRVNKEMIVSFVDSVGDPLEDVRIFIRDTDWLKRKNLNGVDDTIDKTHEDLSDIDGNTGTLAVTTGIVNVDGWNFRGTSNVSPYDIDFRGKNDSILPAPNIPDNTAEFDIAAKAYNYLPQIITKDLVGIGVLSFSSTLFIDPAISEADPLIVAAYTEINNGERLYDSAKLYGVSAGNMEYPSNSILPITAEGSILNLGIQHLIIDGTLLSTFEIVQTGNGTISIDAGVTFSINGFDAIKTTGNVTVEDLTNIDSWTFDGDLYLNDENDLTGVTITGDLRINTGIDSILSFQDVVVNGLVYNDDALHTLTITADNCTMTAAVPGTGVGETNIDDAILISISNANLIDGTDVWLYNVTQAIDLDYSVVSGGGGYTFNTSVGTGKTIEIGDTISMKSSYNIGTTYYNEVSDVAVASVSDITFLSIQSLNNVLTGYGVDGSLQTNFSVDYPNIEVDIDSGDTTRQQLLCWYAYIVTTLDGFKNFFGGITNEDEGNSKINTTVVDLRIDYVGTGNSMFTDDIRLYRDDGLNIFGGTGDNFYANSGKVYIAETGISGLTPSESAQLLAIPVDTAPSNEYDVRMAALQADLDDTDQYKADVSGLSPSGEYDTELANIQTDIADIWNDPTGISSALHNNVYCTEIPVNVDTSVPQGSPFNPFTSLTDACTYAVDNNILNIEVTGEPIFTSGIVNDFRGIYYTGHEPNQIDLWWTSLTDSAQIYDCVFRNIRIIPDEIPEGSKVPNALINNCTIYNCHIGGPTQDCTILDSVVAPSYNKVIKCSDTIFKRCIFEDVSTARIAGRGMQFIEVTGILKLEVHPGDAYNAPSHPTATVNLTGGTLDIDSTCDTGTEITVTGYGTLIDNSQAGAIVINELIDLSGLATSTEVQLIKAKTDLLQFDINNNVEVVVNDQGVLSDITVAEVWSYIIETGFTADQVLKVAAAVNAGKLSGAETTQISIRNLLDTKDVVVATVDENGNRLSVTYDVS